MPLGTNIGENLKGWNNEQSVACAGNQNNKPCYE
jgi:hypothetical protein